MTRTHEDILENRENRNAPPVPTTTNSIPNVPIQQVNDNQKKVMNWLLRFLSPQDRAALQTTYGLAEPVGAAAPDVASGQDVSGELRNYYLGKSRAEQTLAELQAGVGTSNYGPGYQFLKNTIELLRKYGGESESSGISRENYSKMADEFQSLLDLNQNSSEVQPYINLAKMFITPNLSSGNLQSYSVSGGKKIYGVSNKKLYE